MEKIPLIVVAGPTASGKTRLAVEIAKRYSGEVVSADSMQIYKYMDIGTAKPTPQEMAGPFRSPNMRIWRGKRLIAFTEGDGFRFWPAGRGCISIT